MSFHELKCGSNNLTRSVIVILIIKAVHTLRMIGETEGNVSREGFFSKSINRIIHRRHLISTGSRDEDWRDLTRVFV